MIGYDDGVRTYLYSGEPPWRNGLAHTSVHNTVTVDDKDQMTMLSRFTWTNWSKGKVLKHDKDTWQGEHNGYKPVSHKLMPVSVGLNASGQATPALLKRLAALGLDESVVQSLKRASDGKSDALFFDSMAKGATLTEGLQKALDEALAKLPIP